MQRPRPVIYPDATPENANWIRTLAERRQPIAQDDQHNQDDQEEPTMGGKPNPSTPADKRLQENKGKKGK